ncbi:hypothetical protein [Vibrio sp. PNB23_22_7]
MRKFIAENFDLILLLSFTFLLGIVIGFSIQSRNDGLFVDFEVGESRFAIGKNNKNLLILDLGSLSSSSAKQISSEIEKLPATENPLSLEMRIMVREAKGPFEPIESTVTLRLTDSPFGDGGVVCPDSPILNHAVLAAPPEQYHTKELRAFKAFSHKLICTEDNVSDMWVSRKFVESWLGEDVSKDTIVVTAYLIPSSL